MTIDPTADLGSALLIAEFEGGYAALLEKGEDCPCPAVYKLWKRGFDGSFQIPV